MEQRQSAGTATQQHYKSLVISEKEGTSMTKSNNSEPLRSHRDSRKLFLLALRVGVEAVSLWVHPISFNHLADRTLPYAV